MQSLTVQTLFSPETGTKEGSATNYAYNGAGDVHFSDGAHLREIREIAQSKGPFFAYVSKDAAHITGWKGNKLMSVTSAKRTGAGAHGKTLHIRANDAHGREWYGKNGGPGMSIQMKLKKV